MAKTPKSHGLIRLLLIASALAAIGLVIVASASAAPPQNTAAPTISGTAK